MTIVTSDLSCFGYRELEMAVNLLSKYAKLSFYSDRLVGNNVQVMFNAYSGHVFLTDDDLNVAMLNGDRLERWYSCGNCGHEGFANEFKRIKNDDGKLRCHCGEVIRK